MNDWQRQLAESVESPDDLPDHLVRNREAIKEVASVYPMRITPYYLHLIREPDDPLWRQVVPDPVELSCTLSTDPLNEKELSPVPGLIHRYPDRVVWLASGCCAAYCRFCMRKGRVASRGTVAAASSALDYISSHGDIRDVVLSGGDPLLLDDDALEELLKNIRSIRHVEIIRIGTRVPVTLPSRITARLCMLLKRFQPLYINTHFNHPLEITDQSSRACGMLADAGIPLGNQTVLLRGVNDDPAVMKRLMQGLLSIRVRPYYIHQMDLIRGTGHFRTPVKDGIAILEGLRGHTSGLCNPHYVIDVPGGKGKVPVTPETVRWNRGKLLLRNYQGEEVEYEDIV